MATERTRDLLFPITILIAVAVGAVIGGSFARSGADGRPPSNATNTDSKALVDAIDAMRAELSRTREQLAITSSSTPSSGLTESRSVSLDTTSDMRKATAQLIEAAGSLRAAASRAGGDSAPLIPPTMVDPKALQDVFAQDSQVNNKTYLLWTFQQVMDRLGAPDRAGKQDALTYWGYDRRPNSVLIYFADGRVSNVQTFK